jgi:hypothetical protein
MVAKATEGWAMCPKRCSGVLASRVTFLPGHLPDEVDNSEATAVHIPLGVERLGPVRGAAAVRALFSCSGNSASLIVAFRPRIVRTAPSWRWSVSVCAARVRTAPIGSVSLSLSLASKGTRILPRGGGATGMGGAAKERGRPNTAHAVGTCTVLWRPRSPAPILQLPDGAFAARMPMSRLQRLADPWVI